MSNELKDLKKALKLFKQAKKNTEPKTEKRIELDKKIKETKDRIKQIVGSDLISDRKREIINELYQIDSNFKMINLLKYSEEELAFTLNNRKSKLKKGRI